MRALVVIIGFVALAIGFTGLAAPGALVAFGRSLETVAALYIIAALRLAFGLVLIRAAPGSRTPAAFRVLGALLMILGALTPLFGVERSRALLDSWSSRGLWSVRAAAAGAAAFGLFLIFAVTPRRSNA